MLFYSPKFFLFLPVVLSVYWALRGRDAKLLFLLAASYVFYMTWSAKLIVLLWLSTIIDYYAVVWMSRTRNLSARRTLLALSLIFNLGMLVIFKYANFFLHDVFRLTSLPYLDIVLPLGISFYTFETLCYTVDCYYGETEPFPCLRDYAFFISFFPHLIAGPIIRPRQFLPQIKRLRALADGDVAVGAGYFLLGLVKKLVVADHLARYVDSVFARPQSYGGWTFWAASAAYAMQIYCDFSGYTNMAVGLARLFGFDLPANFRAPYLSRSIAEFWQRWHITLTEWIKDYLFTPLALRLARASRYGVFIAGMITMFLAGLWHGAGWHFVAFGLYHGLLLTAHALLNRKSWIRVWGPAADLVPRAAREVLSRAAVFLLVCVGWVFFRAPAMPAAGRMIAAMLVPLREAAPFVPLYVPALVALVFGYEAVSYIDERRGFDFEAALKRAPALAQAGAFSAAIFCLLAFSATNVKPFIYFQF